MDIRKDANQIIEYAIKEVQPNDAVKRALDSAHFGSGTANSGRRRKSGVVDGQGGKRPAFRKD